MLFKPPVRRQMRARRSELNLQVQHQCAEQVAIQLLALPAFIDAQKIGYYLSQENELDPAPLITVAQGQQKQLFLPVVQADSKQLLFYSHHQDEPLQKNRYAISEPVTTDKTPQPLASLDLLIIPLVAFDAQCQRIGRGVGYYDHTLHDIQQLQRRPVLLALGYEFQQIPDCDPHAWDVPMDIIVTEKTTYTRPL